MNDIHSSQEKQNTEHDNNITPNQIFQIGTGFMASKTLLVAVKMELFTLLAQEEKLTGEQIQEKLELHPRSVYDFLDSLVSLNFLQRDGEFNNSNDSNNIPHVYYYNTRETDHFLDKSKPSYIGGILEMMNRRAYRIWDDLEEGLKTGKPQSEVKHTGRSVFQEMYSQPEKMKVFAEAMTGRQMSNFIALAKRFDFSSARSLCDVGGSLAMLSIQIALHHSHVQCKSIDLPVLTSMAQDKVKEYHLQDRIEVMDGNFLQEPLPKADIITMGNILHDWDLEKKKMLLRKAFEALPLEKGVLIVIEKIIDDERRAHTSGLLMSLHMMMETGDGFNFTARQFDIWAKEVGFKKTESLKLEPDYALLAYK